MINPRTRISVAAVLVGSLIAGGGLMFTNPIMDFGAYRVELGKIPTDVANVKALGAKGDGVTDDRAAIQAALDEYDVVIIPAGGNYFVNGTLSLNREKQKLIALSPLTVNNPIQLNAKAASVEFTKITAPNGGFSVNQHYCEIRGRLLDGVGKTGTGIHLAGSYCHIGLGLIQNFASGIKFVAGTYCIINMGHILNCTKGLLFDPGTTGAAGENRIIFGNISNSDIGIHFTSSARWMEGNLLMGGVFRCSTAGIQLDAGGDHKFTTFIGVSDQVESTGQDLIDNGTQNLWIFYFARPNYITVSQYSLIINVAANPILQASYRDIIAQNANLISTAGLVGARLADLSKGVEIHNVGAIELWNNAGTPYIDFKDLRTTDYDARIIKTASHGLAFLTGGATAPVAALELSSDGHLISRRVYRADYGGNFTNFTPPAADAGKFFFAQDTNATNPAKRLYVCLDGATWSYVNLT